MIATSDIHALKARFPRLSESAGSAWRALRRKLGRPYQPNFGVLAHWRPRQGEAFIDIGSHKGEAIDAIRLFQTETPIHAFEPNPHLIAGLALRHFDDDALALYNCGLAGHEGASRFYMPVYGDFIFDSFASFTLQRCTSAINARTLRGFDPMRLEMMACEAQHFTLDELEINAGLIKLSETGNELALLKGAEATLKHCAPLVLASAAPVFHRVLVDQMNFTPVVYRQGQLHQPSQADRQLIYVPYQRRLGLEKAGLA